LSPVLGLSVVADDVGGGDTGGILVTVDVGADVTGVDGAGVDVDGSGDDGSGDTGAGGVGSDVTGLEGVGVDGVGVEVEGSDVTGSDGVDVDEGVDVGGSDGVGSTEDGVELGSSLGVELGGVSASSTITVDVIVPMMFPLASTMSTGTAYVPGVDESGTSRGVKVNPSARSWISVSSAGVPSPT